VKWISYFHNKAHPFFEKVAFFMQNGASHSFSWSSSWGVLHAVDDQNSAMIFFIWSEGNSLSRFKIVLWNSMNSEPWWGHKYWYNYEPESRKTSHICWVSRS